MLRIPSKASRHISEGSKAGPFYVQTGIRTFGTLSDRNDGKYNEFFPSRAGSHCASPAIAPAPSRQHNSRFCRIKNCDPGITIQEPAAVTDQTSPFSSNATVQQAQAPITEMKAYVDNNVVATSGGPTILSNVSATPGTHLLTVQAWDASGNLYKSEVSVNVQ